MRLLFIWSFSVVLLGEKDPPLLLVATMMSMYNNERGAKWQ
jgi:hypothetical protein